MGLEALSRGAAECVFVEDDSTVAAVLRENIQALDYESDSRVVTSGYLPAAKTLVQKGVRFDLLFVDPPYRMLAEVEVMLTPLVPSLLTADGVVVVEGDKGLDVTFGLNPVFERTYGDTRVTMITMRRTIP
jgi:16S rRNA (guanine966-N2)-methyltransferase